MSSFSQHGGTLHVTGKSALCFGIMADHYYRGGKNPVLAAVGRRAVGEVLAEYAS
ncbi:hypothetical protein ABT063_02360 [Streptomyces sp. NPDC002838]|uniref:hypothetical protein n=1 Tax=Streptomyces sp. NPDC002838 TaxID=3154436 RepID=UPI0033307850